MKQIKNDKTKQFLNETKDRIIDMVKLLGVISIPICLGFMIIAADNLEKNTLKKGNIELNEGTILGTQDISGIFSSKKVITIDANNNGVLDKDDTVLTLKLNNDTNKKAASLAKTGSKILTLDTTNIYGQYIMPKLQLIYVTAIQNSNQKYDIIETPNKIIPNMNVNKEKINTLFEKTVSQR